MSKQPSSQKDSPMILALILFIGAGVLVFAYLAGDGNKTSTGAPRVVKSEKFERSVNRHLMLTNERMELEKRRMAVENAKTMNNNFSSTKSQNIYENDGRLDLSSDTRSEEIARELGRGPREQTVESPHDVIQSELYGEELSQAHSQAYREEYARQFVENARRGGYKVKLSSDLSRVISVQPIKKQNKGSEGMDIFSGSVSGRQ